MGGITIVGHDEDILLSHLFSSSVSQLSVSGHGSDARIIWADRDLAMFQERRYHIYLVST
jgi:hypothetical protein